MDTARLKKFAQYARRALLEQVSAKLKLVLAENSAARRESPEAVQALEKALVPQPKQTPAEARDQLIDRVAYTWFNRFCALRFMDVNRYTRAGVVSPAEGQFQPEILADAKMGHMDDDMPEATRQKVFALLNGTAPSPDPQGEAYRLLVVAACNVWHKAMPFLFERINDYTELLMPDDLLSGTSILAYTREAMTPDACENVEVIGWLYQFYISEKKDEVFGGLKKNQKITPENIPAATQLFTPHWIVRYLVENSLGRLWMLNRPQSRLVERMDYYIKPEQAETDFLRIASPEDIKICDPACGSGHMLTYAFDLLYAMYEEEGADPTTIAEKILTHNLYGVEIDERAGDLAALALVMKAREKNRRFLSKEIKPSICVLENVTFAEGELKSYAEAMGRELFTPSVLTTLHQFEEADNFGSLIRPAEADVAPLLHSLQGKGAPRDIQLHITHEKVLCALQQAAYLSQRYHVVIANPPYMGGKGMNGRLGAWAKDNYPDSKSDLFAMFMERNLELALEHGAVAMITMQSWMFLSSFESLRSLILGKHTILSMAHLGARAFDSIGGEVVSTTTFVLENAHKPNHKGEYLRLVGGNSEAEKANAICEAIQNPACGWFFRASAADFAKIPGSPVAYWVSERMREIFIKANSLGNIAKPRQGMATTNNELFLRRWYETAFDGIEYNAKDEKDAVNSKKKWFPYNKGGDYRKWFGNNEYIVNYEKNGKTICDYIDNTPGAKVGSNGRVINKDKYFKESITWSFVSSAYFGVRYSSSGFIFDVGGSSVFPEKSDIHWITGLLCSKLSTIFLRIMNPTLNFQVGNVSELPVLLLLNQEETTFLVKKIIFISKSDWDAYETSWDFTSLPLLAPEHRKPTLAENYATLRQHWQGKTDEMQKLEEENNRIFIEAYGLQDELTPDVPLKEITLTCNPHYRYGGDKTPQELEALLLADTMREFISYAVGCMFGRYALEKPGLVLANQGETLDDYLAQVPDPSFPADNDNVIPILDGYWFEDDMADRIQSFVRLTFGQENYAANVAFIEEALGKSLRAYFVKDIYADHLKRYKKRPIYWLFSSPGGSFNALIYMHRYRPDTVSVVLNDYLREFRTKLKGRKEQLEAVSIGASPSQGEKTKALKEIEKIKKMLTEIDDYERDTLYPLATRQISIDLDDGVKVNYLKFGSALKKIPGLEAKEE